MTPPHYADASVTLYAGDALDILRGLPDNSVDSVVTDPPAGIAFMAKEWDDFRRARNPNDAGRDTVHGRYSRSGPEYGRGSRENFSAWLAEIMREALRVTKPGGHALVWALPRTAHWTACGLEDAGWEIRDRITHLFGSGFPKSLDVGKAIDRARGDGAAALAVTCWLRDELKRAGLSRADLMTRGPFSEGQIVHWLAGTSSVHPGVPTWGQWERLREVIGFGDDMDAEVWRLNGRKGTPGEAWAAREVVGTRKVIPGVAFTTTGPGELTVTAPATDAARRWDGWGTALKPAAEDWWLCRRPLEGTVAGNVVRWGTGAINVDGCRVGSTVETWPSSRGPNTGGSMAGGVMAERNTGDAPAGRWPTNALLDTAAAQQLDRETGITTSGSRKAGEYGLMGYQGADAAPMPAINGDSGGCSRFFPTFAPPDPLPAWRYEPKAPAFERPRVAADETEERLGGSTTTRCAKCGKQRVNVGTSACVCPDPEFVRERATHVAHPTVKPLDLIRWLCRLITPPGGTILDMFAGSGTTGEAAVVEGFRAILVEREPAYLPLIVARLSKPIQPDLFGGVA